ncbi:hypothetical protein WALBB_640004 [Wolbachia pipientis wAlbB]|nr:hypothetical protein WALBB_640004 [Wolbachia pipientis wAlbB]
MIKIRKNAVNIRQICSEEDTLHFLMSLIKKSADGDRFLSSINISNCNCNQI